MAGGPVRWCVGPFLFSSPSPAEIGRPENVIPFFLEGLLVAQAPAQPDPYGFLRMMLPLAGIMVLFYFMLVRPQKRKEQEIRQMVENLKENDHVVTIGGIHGVVTNVQRDADRVTIRVDETTGAKIKVGMSAVARVVTENDQNGGTAAGKSK